MKLPNAKNNPLVIAFASLAASGVAPVIGNAEEIDSNIAIQEVIVTAQKRAQNLQEVPVSITAFTEFEMESKGITTITDLEKSTPNAQFRASRATNSTLTAYIRGVGQQDPLWGFEPGVGVYVDDVYYARPQAAVLDVFDVERIEVLRGPQGTLYGKNTVGGAIKYITKKMEGEAQSKIKVATGTENQLDVIVSGQLPLMEEKLYIGGAVARLTQDGFGTVRTGYDLATGTFTDSEENYNKDVLVYRLSAEYAATDNLRFRLAYDNTDDDSNQRCGSQSSQTLLTHPATGQPFIASGDPFDGDCGTTHKSNVENEGFSVTVDYDISESLALKYVYADRKGETQQFIDFESTPLDSFDVPASYTDDQQTHEFQINYSAERYALVGGLYYFTGNSAGAFDVVLNGNPYFDGEHLDLAIGGDVDTESLSAYFNGSFDVTDTVTLTAGLRATRDDKNSNIQRFTYITANSFPYTTTQGSGFTFGDPADDTLLGISTNITDDEADESWTELSPSVKVDWKATENILLYLSYSEGFKSGGFDMRGNAVTNPNVADGYDPEIVKSWEAGIKSELLRDRLRLNFTVFDMDYEDMQLTVQTAQPAPIFFSSDVVNAGTAEIKGFELEALAQLTEKLSSTLSIGHMNAELTKVISAGVDVSDTWELLNAPDWNGQLGISYATSFGDMGRILLNTSVAYRDASRNFNNVTCSCDQDESYTLWDASANWYSADDRWAVNLYLKNIEDEEYKTGGYNLGSGELAFYGPPRTWTLALSYQF